MTQIIEIDKKCSVCGNTSPQPALMSTNCFGHPDLDLRPAEMQRSTMNTWIAECPHCGYVSNRLEDELEIDKEYLQSEEYLTCSGMEFKSELSKRFYKAYLIAKQSNNIENCFYSLRNCAWKCDDYNDENASKIRKLAIPYLDEIIKTTDEHRNDFILIKADLLRRSGEFEQLIEEYSSIKLNDALRDSIIKFQIQKAQEKDSACYTVEDVINQ